MNMRNAIATVLLGCGLFVILTSCGLFGDPTIPYFLTGSIRLYELGSVSAEPLSSEGYVVRATPTGDLDGNSDAAEQSAAVRSDNSFTLLLEAGDYELSLEAPDEQTGAFTLFPALGAVTIGRGVSGVYGEIDECHRGCPDGVYGTVRTVVGAIGTTEGGSYAVIVENNEPGRHQVETLVLNGSVNTGRTPIIDANGITVFSVPSTDVGSEYKLLVKGYGVDDAETTVLIVESSASGVLTTVHELAYPDDGDSTTSSQGIVHWYPARL